MYEDRGRGYFEDSTEQRQMLSRSLTGVFVLMFLGLIVSAATAWFVLHSYTLLSFIFGTSYGFYLFLFGELALVLFAFPRIWGLSSTAGILLFFAYAVLNGVTLSTIFFAYDLGTITMAFAATAGMFGVMAVYGAVTGSDLSSAGSFLFMGLIGVILATLLNIFIRSTTFDTIICYAAIAIFVGLTAYDTQKIKQLMLQHYDAETTSHLMVMGALTLYLDFINIFLRLLRLMGRNNKR